MTSFTDHVAGVATGPHPVDDPTPVTVVTGFLGAGKTTLLNNILAADHGLRIAVMVNDFGSIDIDGRLIVGVEGDLISLANGCICCTMQDGMVDEFEKLLQRSGPSPDHIVIEASGISDPGGIVRALGYPRLRARLSLDSIVAIVDAEHFDDLNGEAAIVARRQVGLADIVMINKVDLVDAEQVARVVDRVRVPSARIVETTHSAVPLELLGIGGTDPNRAGPPAASAVLANESGEFMPHAPPVTTWTWSTDAPIDLARLRTTLAQLPPSVFRAKGFAHLADRPDRRVIVHVVGGRHELTLGDPWNTDEPSTELVLIGLDETFDPSPLEAMLTG